MTSVLYQAILYNDKQNLKFTVFLRSNKLRKINKELIIKIQRMQQTM